MQTRIDVDKSRANQSIGCTVEQCAYHCESKDYCSLDKIMVGTHEQNPTRNQCIDCESFSARQNS